jgi:shikimate dehydrogenase
MSWRASRHYRSEKTMLSLHGETALYGIFGYPIGHSLSPLMHNTAFAHHGIDAVYLPFAVHPSRVESAVKAITALQLRGVNVTIPHKQAVMPWLDTLSPEARLISAVNTIHLQDGHLYGYNTDGIGFLRSLEEAGGDVTGSTVMLLGAGGAARAIAVQLCLSGIRRLLLANRTQARVAELATFLKQHLPDADISIVPMGESSLAAQLAHTDIVVNATSVGMHADDASLLPLAELGPRHLVCDIVYRPLHTVLLRTARQQGAQTVDGLGMLLHQGAKAFEIWTGQPFPIPLIRARLLEALAEQPIARSPPSKE